MKDIVAAALAAVIVLPAHAADAPLGADAAKTLPIADAHFHFMPFMTGADLLAHMDTNGVRWAGGAGSVLNVGNGSEATTVGAQRTAEIAGALAKRYIPSTGQAPWVGLKRAGGAEALEDAASPAFQRALQVIEQALQNGARVIGEIHVNTLRSARSPLLTHRIDADAPTLKALLTLGARYKRPLNIHAQRDSFPGIGRLAESNRDGRVVVAHCGSDATASDVRELMEKNTNVYCDLSYRSPPQIGPRVIGRSAYDANSLRADWKSLIEDYPDRFYVGIDDVTSWNEYDAVVHAIRNGLLANLSPATAEKVAHRNAVALFGLE
ncbi:MAG: amidohydrolase family protein [Rhodospirillaceae bacterium]